MDRWKIEIKDLNGDLTILHAEPSAEIMAEFVTEATRELNRRILMAEEQMILGSSSTEVLTRIRNFCEIEIERRRVPHKGSSND